MGGGGGGNLPPRAGETVRMLKGIPSLLVGVDGGAAAALGVDLALPFDVARGGGLLLLFPLPLGMERSPRPEGVATLSAGSFSNS